MQNQTETPKQKVPERSTAFLIISTILVLTRWSMLWISNSNATGKEVTH
jgi:hypothetical protein